MTSHKFKMIIKSVSDTQTVAEIFLTDDYSEQRVFDQHSRLLVSDLLPGDECELTVTTEGNVLTYSIKNLLAEEYEGC